MVRGVGFRGKFHLVAHLEKGTIIKASLMLVLLVIALLLFYANEDLMKENRKMIKYIKNQEVFQRDLEQLRKSEGLLEKYFIKIGKNKSDADLEKIKSGYIDQLLARVKKSDLQVDSYRSEMEKSRGFVIFKYNVTIVGEFVQLLRFFYRLLDQAKHIYVSRYDIRLHLKTKIRMGLAVEIIGME